MTLTCEDLVRYLSDYIDGDLDPQLTEAAKQHLATCQNCRIVLDSTQRTILFYKDDTTTISATRKTALFDELADLFQKKM
ncbi:MAG: hypothetical protein CUN56_07965 [Phototrophicales bacterium]|nr:MAG: hypothetical protein CUN56_07965 [Phototrophicales bacterium]RMG72513.1 MAG: zf-HC2 domain-containing protein [Chloroflexota bacterium]